ncbi:MAG: DUF1566 domain-containing protein [Gallionellaceae bacterium]
MMKNMIWVALLTLSVLSPTLANAAPNPRYIINGGEVYDKDNNLTWQRCSVGQDWKEGTGCVGTVKTFTFQDASRQANGNWRVPTREELATLIDQQRQNFPTIDMDAFPDMNEEFPTYWTSTPSDADRSWDVRFTDGNVTDDVSVRRYAVRLVRSGK